MVDIRYAAALVLLALVPMALYVIDRGYTVVALSAISVLLIAASLYLALGSGTGEEPPART